MLLVDSLPPQRADRAPTFLELVGHFVRVPERLEKDVRRHRELEPAPANVIADVEHALAKLNAGSSCRIENGLKVMDWHSTPRGKSTAERDLSANALLNAHCTKAGKPPLTISQPARLA